VLKAIEEFGVTTLDELKEKLDWISPSALTHSLSKLKKWNEIITTTLTVRTIYFSQDFFSKIKQIDNGK